MAVFPVSEHAYSEFVNASDGFGSSKWWRDLSHRPKAPPPALAHRALHPQVNVSWYEAVAYCRWRSHREGEMIRLPTDWEWCRAAGAPSASAFTWGERFCSSACNTIEGGIGTVAESDRFPRNVSLHGVRDMCGNVWERCLGVYSDPRFLSVQSELNRVIRGGSWRYSRREARIDASKVCVARRRFDDGGFRVMRTSEDHWPERVEVIGGGD